MSFFFPSEILMIFLFKNLKHLIGLFVHLLKHCHNLKTLYLKDLFLIFLIKFKVNLIYQFLFINIYIYIIKSIIINIAILFIFRDMTLFGKSVIG